MLKRLIGVVSILNDHVVQSISFKKYHPIGSPQVIVENLDRWQLDEVLINCFDRTKSNLGPNFTIMEKIAKLGTSTPITYMGGVRSLNDSINLIQLGADRIGIETLFNTNYEEVINISESLGRQAIIRSQSFVLKNGKYLPYNYLQKKNYNYDLTDTLVSQSEYFSELLLIDKCNEGNINSFSNKVLNQFNKFKIQIICFGGISNKNQIKKLFDNKNVSAAAIGNFLNYKEIANKDLIIPGKTEKVRFTSFGARTKGAKEWQ